MTRTFSKQAFNAQGLSDAKIGKALIKALNTISLIKEKRSGILKGRICADGQHQHDQYDKSKTTLPTISTPALMTTIAIDAKEKQGMATTDIISVYLNVLMPDNILMCIEGAMINIYLAANPSL